MADTKKTSDGVQSNMAVFGIYSTYAGIQSAAEALQAAGFRTTDVAALVSENQGSKDIGHEKHSKAPEGALTGGIIGGIVGGALGWLVATGVIAVSGFAPLASAGPVIATLAGIGALGGLGFVIGAAAGGASSEYVARRYRGRVRTGGLLLSVHCDNREWCKRAGQTLKMTGAAGISEARESGADYASTDKPLPRTVTGGGVQS
ncbi:MAG TPA: DUF3341 domain-containing protein [Terriglobia bacterium]|nr:DUF3341 domain-containing protein [Terriglobia bacterium]